MSKPILTAVAASVLLLASCIPPDAYYDTPPPRFKPRPPYPPEQVEPYDQNYDPYGQDNDVSPPPPQQTRPGDYPTARKTANPNEVISPYDPYNLIDVEGFTSGQLARDPSNNKIFRVP